MLRDALFQRVLSYYLSESEATRYATEVAEHKRDPYSLVEKIVDRIGDTIMSEIDHLGIAVKSLARGQEVLREARAEAMPEETVEAEKVRLSMVPVGESRIELLEPTVGRFDDCEVSGQARRRAAPRRPACGRSVRHGGAVEGQRNASHLRRDQSRRRRTFVRLRASLQRRRRAAGTGGRRSPGRLAMLVIAIEHVRTQGKRRPCRGDADSFEVPATHLSGRRDLFGAADAGNFAALLA